MMMPSGNTPAVHGNVTSQVGAGGARRVPVAPPDATGDGPPPAINVSLGGFLLLFVASRLLYVVLIHPGYVPPQLGDELYVGTIAQELVTGLTLPFPEYRTNNFALGTLVIGALAAGFFLLFGPTLFALKLAALLVSTLALAFWYSTLQRAAGERVACYFALLFCFSPPLLTARAVVRAGLCRGLCPLDHHQCADSLCRARGQAHQRVGALRTRTSVGRLGPSLETLPC